MARERKQRRPWTPTEDEKLIYFKKKYPKGPWGKIRKEAGLQGRNDKSCSHRWNNYLRCKFIKEKFSQEQDKLIIDLKSRRVSWALMREEPLLARRSANAIKNRWNNNLVKRTVKKRTAKKRTATVSEPRRPLPNHVQQPLMNIQTLSDAEIEAWISSLFNDDDQTHISSIPVSDPMRPLPNHVQQPLMNIQTLSDAEIEAWISSLFNDDDQTHISSIPVSDPMRPLPNHVQLPLMNDQTNDYSFSNDDFKALISSWI